MLFSVVIPTYNRESVIKRAVDSVLNQTIQDFEIIVVDDGSKDKTEEVMSAYTDPRVKYIKQKNGGACAARNNGIEHAQGYYIAFLDSDDTYETTMLESLLDKFQSDSEIGFVYTKLDCIDSMGVAKSAPIKSGIQGHCYKEALEQGYIAPTSVVSAKREAFGVAGMFDLSLPASQDDDICFKLAKIYKVGFVNEVLAHMYNDTNNRITNVRNPAKGWWMLWNKYENDVVELCGTQVMARHYLNCCHFFLRAEIQDGFNKAFEKYRYYGGNKSKISLEYKYKLKSMMKTIKGLISCKSVDKPRGGVKS